MFKAIVVAQMAAVFAAAAGGTINLMKLLKLMYLADRESMDQSGFPISGDRYVSMDHGPVLSRTLNLINGATPGGDGETWERWISDKEHYDVRLSREFDRGDLNYLSDFEIGVLDAVWGQFGHMNQWQLRDYTHTLPEWTDPHHSSIPIVEKDIFLALGADNEEAESLASELEAQRSLDRLLATA